MFDKGIGKYDIRLKAILKTFDLGVSPPSISRI